MPDMPVTCDTLPGASSHALQHYHTPPAQGDCVLRMKAHEDAMVSDLVD